MTPLFSVEDLVIKYPAQEVPTVDRISWSQGAGEVVLLMGRNGSGKSTVIHALAGDCRVTMTGRLRFRDVSVHADPQAWFRRGVRWIPQQGASFQSISVAENLQFTASSEGVSSIDPALELFPDLRGLLSRQVRHLSGGQQRMADLAPLALARNPSMFWLDEPVAALSPLVARRFSEFLIRKRDSGVAILLANHVRDFEIKPDHEVFLDRDADV